MPMLYAGFVPSTLTRTMRPSGSWPIAPRAWRPLSWRDGNASPAWKVGLPFFTSSGPPPIALARPLQSGESESSASTCCPTGASAVSWAVDCVPRATSTAPPDGIGVGPAVVTCVTVPSSGWFSRAAGNVPITASTTPASRGVEAPYAGV